VAGGSAALLATNEPPSVWQDFAPRLMPEGAELAEYVDASRGLVRIAAFYSGHLEGVIFMGPATVPPHWDVVRALFASAELGEGERRVLLSGQSGAGVAEAGPLICACFGVGLVAIRDAIVTGAVADVADIGRTLRAGTNCGSCVPELRGILERVRQAV
jgi:assimilatory nitrate reductase catalytic subunit